MEAFEVAGKRVVLENPAEFFSFIKQSPKFVTWERLRIEVGCGGTTLKKYRRGKTSLPGEMFARMLCYLPEEQKIIVLEKTALSPAHQGQSKGGLRSIEKLKQRLGNEGFLDYLKTIRTASPSAGFSGWHNLMKRESPQLYSNMQRQRWLSVLKLWQEKSKYREKAVKSIKERYGSGFFGSLGLKTAEKQELTPREQALIKSREESGFDVKAHKTLFGFNFDFTYYDKGDLKAIEEVLGFRKKKGQLFFDILVLHRKYMSVKKVCDVPFFVTTWKEARIKHKTERLPMELLLWVIEKGMIPVLADTKYFDDQRKEVLCGKPFRKSEASGLIKENLRERKELLEKGAKIQLKQPFDVLEQEVHEKLKTMNLSPQGKKLLRTNYDTFVVPDNFFEKNNESFVLFVSKNDINGVIGSAAIVKELVSKKMKTIGIVLFTKRKRRATPSREVLLKTYVDYFFTNVDDLKQFLGP